MSENDRENRPTEQDQSGAVLEKPDQPASQYAKGRKGVGGTFSHSINCQCNPCKARQRQQETLAIAAGIGGAHLADPVRAITTKTGVKKPAPKGIRERVAQYLHYSMMFPNAPKTEIAEKMGLSAKRLYEVITAGKEAGLIEFSDPMDRIDYEIVPKIVNNLIEFLDAKDKTVTIEAAKGTLFKAYQESRGLNEQNQTVLALKIEVPDGQEVKVLAGRIVGTPKRLADPIIELNPEEIN